MSEPAIALPDISTTAYCTNCVCRVESGSVAVLEGVEVGFLSSVLHDYCEIEWYRYWSDCENLSTAMALYLSKKITAQTRYTSTASDPTQDRVYHDVYLSKLIQVDYRHIAFCKLGNFKRTTY